MVYGVFSDVHANIEALDTVLGFFADIEVGGYICCGDIVGYGPDPNPVVERIAALGNAHLICGNHDLAAIGRMGVEWFNPYAKSAVLWTRERLAPASRRFLETLTARAETPEFTLAHGTPRRPAEEYLMSAAQFRESIDLVKVWPLFVGHSHMPLAFRAPGPGTPVEASFLEHNEEIRVPRGPMGRLAACFNPGSVGQPRDQDPRACCGLYDAEQGSFRIVRLDYDVRAVQAKIRAAGLPEYLALRLAFGQ